LNMKMMMTLNPIFDRPIVPIFLRS